MPLIGMYGSIQIGHVRPIRMIDETMPAICWPCEESNGQIMEYGCVEENLNKSSMVLAEGAPE